MTLARPDAASSARLASFDFIADFAEVPAHGWSIGTFGAIGEFVRDVDEHATVQRAPGLLEVVTARGGLRIEPSQPLVGVAWDTLSADGETWGHAMAFCVPVSDVREATPGIVPLGRDAAALRDAERDAWLFDLGVGGGAVRMAVRTRDESLAAKLEAAAGRPTLEIPGLMAELLRAQPHRVMVSPAGRLEVYQPIPSPDGRSPDGPHTHLLPKLIGKGFHSANTPLPSPLQSVLTLHPRSPWRSPSGLRHAYEPAFDAVFCRHLQAFGLSEDAAVQASVEAAVAAGVLPEQFPWPESRRGRAKARIVLRRLAAKGDARVTPWRVCHDHVQDERDEA